MRLGKGNPEGFDTLGGTYNDGYDESSRRALYGRLFRGGRRIVDDARVPASRLSADGSSAPGASPNRPGYRPLR